VSGFNVAKVGTVLSARASDDFHAAVLPPADGLSLPSEHGDNRSGKRYSASEFRKGY